MMYVYTTVNKNKTLHFMVCFDFHENFMTISFAAMQQ